MTSSKSELQWYLWTKRGLWIVAVLLLAAVKGPQFLSSLRPSSNVILDFMQEWASARNHFAGLPIYADQSVAIERHLHSRLRHDQLFAIKVNAHPPTSVLLVLPFSRLDYDKAFFLWNLMSLAAFAFSLWLIAHELQFQFTTWAILPLIAGALVCGPLFQQLNQGQLNLVLLPLVIGIWIADRRGHSVLAGSLLGTAVAIKIFPAFLGSYFLARGNWKALVASLVVAAALTGITAGILGTAAYEGYVREAMPQVSMFRDWWANASLTGFWSKLFDAPSHHVVALCSAPLLARIGVTLSCLLVVMAVVRSVRAASSTADLDLAFGATTVAMLLVSPITWDHYFLLLIPLLAILWSRIGSPTIAGWIVGGICIVTLLILVWSQSLLLLMLIPAVVIWVRQAPRKISAIFLAVICIALCVSPKVIFNATIPGNDEMHGGVAQPIHALTVLSYQLYALLGLFVFSLSSAKEHAAPKGEGKMESNQPLPEHAIDSNLEVKSTNLCPQ